MANYRAIAAEEISVKNRSASEPEDELLIEDDGTMDERMKKKQQNSVRW